MGKDGRCYPRIGIKEKKQFIIDNCLEPQVRWDEWNDYRDGYRDIFGDGKLIKRAVEKINFSQDCNEHVTTRISRNKKNVLLLDRQKVRRQNNKRNNKNKVYDED